jgi:hypothetical protein
MRAVIHVSLGVEGVVVSGEARKSTRRQRRWNWSVEGIVESWIEVAEKVSDGSKRGVRSVVDGLVMAVVADAIS